MRNVPVKLCTYDNPATMAREHWVNGEFRMHIQATVLLGKDFKGGSWFPMQLNIGEWEPGRIVGDPDALRRGVGNE